MRSSTHRLSSVPASRYMSVESGDSCWRAAARWSRWQHQPKYVALTAGRSESPRSLQVAFSTQAAGCPSRYGTHTQHSSERNIARAREPATLTAPPPAPPSSKSRGRGPPRARRDTSFRSYRLTASPFAASATSVNDMSTTAIPNAPGTFTPRGELKRGYVARNIYGSSPRASSRRAALPRSARSG